MILFSIVTVCFNSVKTIRDTFNSILSQSCYDYEYIVIDGGSNDGTIEIIKEYEPKFEGRMQWISENDNGIYDAMNKGIRLSKGEYLNFMNSDDTFEYEALAKTREIIQMNHNNFVIYYGITRTINSEKQEISISRKNHNFLEYMTINHQACFIHKQIFEKYGNFDIKYKICADYKLLLIAKLNNEHFYPMDHIIVNYYQDGLSRILIDKTREENEKLKYELKINNRWNLINYKLNRILQMYFVNVILKISYYVYRILKIFSSGLTML